jgi:predicted DNA-binding transcriptional regulator AlpA
MTIKQKRIGPRQGTAVVWPRGVEERYGISAPTRWRWEKLGLLPPRDIKVGGRTGWRPQTLATAEALQAEPSGETWRGDRRTRKPYERVPVQ